MSKSPVLVSDSSSSRARASRVAHAPWLAVLAVGALAACAAGEGDDGPAPPPFGVAGAAGSTGQLPAGSAGNPSNLGGGQAGATGVTPAPGNSGGAGQGGAGGSQSAPPPVGSAGAAGSAGAPADGSAGAPPDGSAGAAGAAPQDPPGEEPSGPDIDCPAGATFCSGFESNEFPAGTQFHSVGARGAENAFSFDTSDPFAGNQALLIPLMGSPSEFQYRALAVPIPGQNFWVRLYMRLSVALGDGNHDSVFGASTGALANDVNSENLIELSEQFDTINLNTEDNTLEPPTDVQLPANQWLCMEAHYDGPARTVRIFADGQEVISATNYPSQNVVPNLNLQTFRFGYMRYNTDRAVAFDDVVVAPDRIGCD